MAQPTHATTGAAPEAHAKGAFPPFASETFASQLLWFAIAFGLLYWLMAKVALPRIGAILEDRTNRIADDLAEAERLRAESEAARRGLREVARRGARQVEGDRAGDARRARRRVRRQRKALEAELNTRIAASEGTISSRTAAAMASVRGIAAEAATAIVARLTGEAPERAAVEAALDRSMAR